MKRFVTSILLALLILPFTANSSEAAVAFLDVDSSHRAYPEISYLAGGNIVNGTGGYFNPNKEVTRAEAATMLGRALNLNGTKRATMFKDVDPGSFASGYIQSAVEKSIISGYQDGTFRPEQPVKRGEMALLINRAFGYGGSDTISAANALMEKGIAQGISPGNFGYDLKIKRADFSVFLARAVNYKYRINAQVEFGGDLQIKADSLNVRTGPSTNFTIVHELPIATKVEAAYRVGDWVFIRSAEAEGLVHGAYLTGTYPSFMNKPLPASTPLNEEMIIIDPGHGGKDPGASGYGIQEKAVVLDTALKVKALLAKTPFSYKLTRETDVYLTLSQRVSLAKSVGGDTFVSIHANAFNGSANGTEVYYYGTSATNPYHSDSKRLAAAIQNRLLAAWKLYDRGIDHGDYHVLRENSMPAVLVELGFIDNKKDNEKLASAWWRQEAAEAIYLGILDYYKAKGYNVTYLYNNVN
ncbi:MULTISPECIES: N-acetylmuramoyl-L-alanine amidase [Mesobacillus]|uniref:N-acetylmuramoyl-L-alanine amidase n=1 Tax=Mesobacillus TaxID=2675231 RepID=UPI00178684DF|nr:MULTISPECIES: N-acetylmuramoyl-L-alanine amidase [Mesobacillus]MCM3574435.1 N-acetylmuramoyl-L-alanine amidase [Mesobacillus subterraneus]UYZ21825.1 N-acetylmuramoyl-L-alanine amidase [Mesobacillus jeotgali]